MENVRRLDCIKEFRKAVVNTLRLTDIAGIGEDVFEARQERAWPEEKGFIVVYTPSLNFDDGRTSPRFYQVSGQVYVDIYCAASSGDRIVDVNDFLDDTMMKVCEALQPVEKRVGPYNGLVKRFVLKSCDNNLSSSGEVDRGSMRITFEVTYAICVTYGGPEDEFLTARNSLRMGDGAANRQDFDTKVRKGV